MRAHQQRLGKFLAEIDRNELRHLEGTVKRHIAEQEVTFNLLGDPEGQRRAWRLDPIPLVLSRADWLHIEAGILQRGRLLSALFADLYGEQRCLKEGIVPAAAVYGNPSFERACFGWKPPGGHQLHMAAFDLGRNQNGSFCVFSDRSAAPAGSGYAMENRIAMAGALGDLFADYRVERLRPFFDAWRAHLVSLSSQDSASTRTVLLSPGLGDESSFEHAYLTRYLGYDLVEGRDLTVRGRRVFLKTLSGLKRVDVVVRRVRDEFCDSLNLKSSFRGVPGLVDAARAGNVALVNPLGAALVESPALRPYLALASEFLLGERFTLPSVKTWWLGDPRSYDYVMAHLDELLIKPAFTERQTAAQRPGQMATAPRAALAEQIQAHPEQFIAEEPFELSVAPVLLDGKLRYGPVSIRTFIARSGPSFTALAGGLARINAGPDGLFLPGEEEGFSKDVWVSAPEGVSSSPPVGMPDGRISLRRGGVDLPSRLLDDLYWLGRSIERCDMTARLLRAGLDRLSTEAGEDGQLALERIRRVLEQQEVIPAGNAGLRRSELAQVFGGGITDDGPQSNLRGQIRGIHTLAIRARSRLSRDAWHNLHRLGKLIEGSSQRFVIGETVTLLDELLVLLSAVRGTTIDNMVRTQAWAFLDMGRSVERGAQTLALLQVMLAPGASRVHMEVLLEIADSLLTYRSRYLSRLQVAPVVDLLLTDATNPRSVAFQATKLREHVASLPRPNDSVLSRAERRVIGLESNLLTADVVEICAGDGHDLRELLEDATNLLWQFSDDVNRAWLAHTPQMRAVSPPLWVNDALEVGP